MGNEEKKDEGKRRGRGKKERRRGQNILITY